MKKRVKLNVKNILLDLEDGLTRPEIAEKYDISVNALNRALTEKGLKGKRATRKSWEWEEDDEDNFSINVATPFGSNLEKLDKNTIEDLSMY